MKLSLYMREGHTALEIGIMARQVMGSGDSCVRSVPYLDLWALDL